MNDNELIQAASIGDQQLVWQLMQNGLDINMQDVDGKTSLIWSCMCDNMNIYIKLH